MCCEDCARLTEAYLAAVKRHALLLERQTEDDEPDLSLAHAEWQVTVQKSLLMAHRNECDLKSQSEGA